MCCNAYLQRGVVCAVGVEHDSMELVGLHAEVHVPGPHLGVLVPDVAVAPKPHSSSWKWNEQKVSELSCFETVPSLASSPA